MIVDGVLFGDDQRVGEWVQRKTGGGIIVPPYVALGMVYGGRIAGGAVFFNRRAGDVEVCIYIGDMRCVQPVVAARVAAYPFVTLGLRRATSEIAASNARSLRNAKKLGFVQEGVKRHAAADGGDVLVMGLYRENFPFAAKLRAIEIEWEAHQAHRSQPTQALQPKPSGIATLQPAALT